MADDIKQQPPHIRRKLLNVGLTPHIRRKLLNVGLTYSIYLCEVEFFQGGTLVGEWYK